MALLSVSRVARAERTLWLVQPLYPGQEALIARTERAIDGLMPKEGRANEVIGRKELAKALPKKGELACLTGEKRCADRSPGRRRDRDVPSRAAR